MWLAIEAACLWGAQLRLLTKIPTCDHVISPKVLGYLRNDSWVPKGSITRVSGCFQRGSRRGHANQGLILEWPQPCFCCISLVKAVIVPAPSQCERGLPKSTTPRRCGSLRNHPPQAVREDLPEEFMQVGH